MATAVTNGEKEKPEARSSCAHPELARCQGFEFGQCTYFFLGGRCLRQRLFSVLNRNTLNPKTFGFGSPVRRGGHCGDQRREGEAGGSLFMCTPRACKVSGFRVWAMYLHFPGWAMSQAEALFGFKPKYPQPQNFRFWVSGPARWPLR